MKRIIAIARKKRDLETVSSYLIVLGDNYLNLGLYAQAEPIYKEQLALSMRDRKFTADGYYRLARLYYWQRGRDPESESLYRKSFALYDELGIMPAPANFDDYINLLRRLHRDSEVSALEKKRREACGKQESSSSVARPPKPTK